MAVPEAALFSAAAAFAALEAAFLRLLEVVPDLVVEVTVPSAFASSTAAAVRRGGAISNSVRSSFTV